MPPAIPDLSLFHHVQPVQLRFNDIDILGHLNNIVYLSLYDLAKAAFLRRLKKGQIDWKKVECVIANINCSYIRPIFFGEEIEVLTRCIRIGERSFTLQQCLVESATRDVRSVCETVMVCFDAATGQSAAMSESLRAALIHDEETSC